MAYIVSYSQVSATAAVTNSSVPLPAHVANDIFLLFTAMDSGNTVTGTGTTGTWVAVGNPTAGDSSTGQCLYRRMQGSGETVTITTTDSFAGVLVHCRDVFVDTANNNILDATSDASFVNNAAGVASATNVSITTANANALVLYSIGQSQVGGSVLSPPGLMHLVSYDNSATTATTAGNITVAWSIQATAGAVPVRTMHSNTVATSYTRFTIALRNATSGQIPPYIDNTTAPGSTLLMAHSTTTSDFGNGNVTISTTMAPSAAVNGKTVTGSSALTADFGVNPYSAAVGNSAANAADTTLIGPNVAFATARDCSTGIIVGSHIASTPKVSAFSLGTTTQGGGVIRLASNTTDQWRAWQVTSSKSKPIPDGRYLWGIQASYTGSLYGAAGAGTFSNTGIVAFQTLANFPQLPSNTSTQGSLLVSEIHHVTTHIFRGGSITFPIDTAAMVELGKSYRLPVIRQQGGSGLISYVPFQIGMGTGDVFFNINGGILQFPKRYNSATDELAWHANDNAVGVTYYGITGDTIKHTNSTITSLTPYYWEIHASATSGATWDFTGLSLIGATVTLRLAANAGFTRMSFNSCPIITASGCTLATPAFSNNAKIIATSATITSGNYSGNTQIDAWNASNTTGSFSGTPTAGRGLNADFASVVSGMSINTTSIAARNTFSQLSATNFDGTFASCAFTGSGSSGHAIEVMLYNLTTPVRVATTTAGTLASSFENGDTIDGVVLATGNRILIKNQAAPAENGIYTVNASGAPTRATDMDAWTEVPNITVAVQFGTVNSGSTWECTSNAGGTLNTTAITFVTSVKHATLTNVRVATTANGALATAYENGDTIDGVVLATGDRILIKDQTSAFENGIYTVNASGAPTRATDSNIWQNLLEAKVQVTAGTTNIGSAWVSTTAAGGIFGVTSITYTAYKQYVCRVATTANGALATAFENGDTIDGVVLATGDRILIKDQSAPAENGIYTVNASGAPTRAIDADEWGEIPGLVTAIAAGTANAQTSWKCTSAHGGTLGTTAITFVKQTAQDVRVATTTAGTLASSFENGDTVNGVVLATGDRILIKNQAAPAENGIYTVNASGAPTRATDMDTWAEVPDIIVKAREGTTDPRVYWDCTSTAGGTLGTTAITFAEYNIYSFVGNTFTSYGANDTTSAAIYNNTGGRLTLNIAGGGGTPTVRNGYGATTVINNAVTLTVTVVDTNNAPVVGANVAIYATPITTTPPTAILSPTATNGSGVVTTSFAYTGDQTITVRVRNDSTTRFLPVSAAGVITASGYTATITVLPDTVSNGMNSF